MTAEHIHDALTLLPADLIAETDKKRGAKPRVIPWKKYAAMAACFALIVYSGWFCTRLFAAKSATSMMAMPEIQAADVYEEAAPAEAIEAPAAREPQAAADSAGSRREDANKEAAAEEAICGLPTVPAIGSTDTAGSQSSDSSVTSENGHSHGPAEEIPRAEEPMEGWCGNTAATLYVGGVEYPLYGEDAIVLTQLLMELEYGSANLCRCMAEFTADTEMGTGYEINLTEYFVRFEGGQAGLTEAQAQALRDLLSGLGA